jgi:nucleoside-diphosphate-sugar epimerase
MGKKILVLGATGAMGQYLVPELAAGGHQVTAVSLDHVDDSHPNLRRLRGDALADAAFRDRLLAEHWDGIVDFLIYTTRALESALPRALAATDHYLYLSSYRVYADEEHPVRESSPRLIDVSPDAALLASDDYCIYKARGENLLRSLPRRNWTIIRPAITYSRLRYQLVTLEAPNTVGRAFAGRPVVLPIQAKDRQATMSWAGDVATMIAGLLLREETLGETYSVCTAEHRTWGEIADYYRDLCGLKSIWVDQEDFLSVIARPGSRQGARWQLEYDRLFDRVMDNARVLAATGLKQSHLMPLYEGLKHEISRCPRDVPWPVLEAMDTYISQRH